MPAEFDSALLVEPLFGAVFPPFPVLLLPPLQPVSAAVSANTIMNAINKPFFFIPLSPLIRNLIALTVKLYRFVI